MARERSGRSRPAELEDPLRHLGVGDPEGRWRLYAIEADPTRTTFADFPTLGFTQSTVAIGINMFSNSSNLAYVRGRLIVLDYASLRSGGSGTPVDISVPGGFALQPAVTYSPTEANLYLVEHVDSMSATYRFWSLRGGTLTLVGGGIRTNPLGPWGTPGPGNVLPQQNGRGVDTGDSRTSNVVFRSGHVYHAQAIALPPGGTGYGTHTAVQWVELDETGAFVQGGRIEDSRALPWNGGRSYAFPSIAVNAREDVLVGFSEFESDDFIDAAYAFRAGTDPPGTMREPVTLKDGEGPYYKTRGGLNRWGDYSGAQVDPSDDLSLWTVQEYPRIPVGPRRRIRALGHLVGPRGRRTAADPGAVCRAERRRRAAQEGVAAGRGRALPPREAEARESNEEGQGPRSPPEPACGPAATERRAGEPDRRPLEGLQTEAILEQLRGCSSVG